MTQVLVFVFVFAFSATSSFASGASSCKEGIKNFPFLASWASKLENFQSPFDVDQVTKSFVYTIGATKAGKDALAIWKKDTATLPVIAGHIELGWIGESQAKEDAKWQAFWAKLLTASELELLTKCSARDCKIKFNPSELARLASAAQTSRRSEYQNIVKDRIEKFAQKGELLNYDDPDAADWTQMLAGSRLPKELGSPFIAPQKKGAQYVYEELDARPGKHKAVLGLVARQCESRKFNLATYEVCTDVVLYNNHYFDFWGKTVFFFPWCDEQLVLLYETMDVDQMKGNAITRLMYGAEIRQLVGRLIETRLKRLHMLSFAP